MTFTPIKYMHGTLHLMGINKSCMYYYYIQLFLNRSARSRVHQGGDHSLFNGFGISSLLGI
jgi:hypothetical protein